MYNFENIIDLIKLSFEEEINEDNDYSFMEYIEFHKVRKREVKDWFECRCGKKYCLHEFEFINVKTGIIIDRIGSICFKRMKKRIQKSTSKSEIYKKMDDINTQIKKDIKFLEKEEEIRALIKNKKSISLVVNDKKYYKAKKGYGYIFNVKGVKSNLLCEHMKRCEENRRLPVWKNEDYNNYCVRVNIKDDVCIDNYLSESKKRLRINIYYKGDYKKKGYVNFYLKALDRK